MKPLAIALMIGALALPAAAVAREHDHGGGERGFRGPAPRVEDYRPWAPPGRGYAPYRPVYPGPGRPFHTFPAPGGYGGPRLRDPGDWNDFGSPRGGAAARWRRGQVFPPAYREAVVGDYYRYHLRRPPPGYYWYRNGDDFILAAVASGLIFEVVQGDDDY